MNKIISAIVGFVLIVHSAESMAQVPIDTTKFSAPTAVTGAIPRLYKWANSHQSDSVDVIILSPIDGQKFREGDSVFVTVSVSGIAIGAQTQYSELCGLANSVEGQHTHVILDNDAYLANYKSGVPLFVGIPKRGIHTLRVFASRSWHESIKSPGSFKMVTFSVGDTTVPATSESAILTYSRPKGVYEGEEARVIMIDFYLSNVSLGPDGHKVRLTIDSASTVLTEWVPYLVAGLEPGEHDFRLELLSPDGMPIGGTFTSAGQVIVVK